MKKNNKLKLSNIWYKIRKPLIILSVVGNILFLLFIIIGCVGNKKQTTQTNAEDEEKVFTLRETRWILNNQIRYTPSGFDMESRATQSGVEYYILHFTLDNEHSYIGLGFDVSDSMHRYMYYTEFGQYGTQVTTNVYHLDYNGYSWDSAYYSDSFRYLNISGGYTANEVNYENTTLINWFYENATLKSDFEISRFTFERNFNYNSPYKNNIDSPFVNQSFSNTSDLGLEKVYDLPMFLSNGQYFNRIRLWFDNGYSVRYIDSDGVMHINKNQNVAYYGFMQYVNTYTNTTILVNSRNYRTEYVSTDDSTQTFVDFGSTWINNDYQYLLFTKPLSTEQRDFLAGFNNAYYSNGLNTTGNIGLGNVFNLISQGFGGLTNILRIQVLPNITIGILLFLPLMVIIIITIIRLVKR